MQAQPLEHTHRLERGGRPVASDFKVMSRCRASNAERSSEFECVCQFIEPSARANGHLASPQEPRRSWRGSTVTAGDKSVWYSVDHGRLASLRKALREPTQRLGPALTWLRYGCRTRLAPPLTADRQAIVVDQVVRPQRHPTSTLNGRQVCLRRAWRHLHLMLAAYR